MTGSMMRLVPALFLYSGRMRRRDFWFYTVFGGIALFILLLIDVIVPQMLFGTAIQPNSAGAKGVAFLVILTAILWAWMTTALLGKRLHDRGKSLVWLLALLVPVVGWGWLLVECGILDGSPQDNRYGVPARLADHP